MKITSAEVLAHTLHNELKSVIKEKVLIFLITEIFLYLHSTPELNNLMWFKFIVALGDKPCFINGCVYE